MIEFSLDGKTYGLTFERNHKMVSVKERRRKTLITRVVKSKYPATTALLYAKKSNDWKEKELEATSVVLCHPNDQFRKDVGRREALAKLLHTLPTKLSQPAWYAYNNRGNKIVQTVAAVAA